MSQAKRVLPSYGGLLLASVSLVVVVALVEANAPQYAFPITAITLLGIALAYPEFTQGVVNVSKMFTAPKTTNQQSVKTPQGTPRILPQL